MNHVPNTRMSTGEVVTELQPGILDRYPELYGTDQGNFVMLDTVAVLAPLVRLAGEISPIGHAKLILQISGDQDPALRARLKRARANIDRSETLRGYGQGLVDAGHFVVAVNDERQLISVGLYGRSGGFWRGDDVERKCTRDKFAHILGSEVEVQLLPDSY